MRAYLLSFTHDESLSWLCYLNESFFAVISNNTKIIYANNHILNTLFMKGSSWLFGNSEFSLRLHSVLAHLVYMVFSYRILRLISTGNYIIIAGFIVFNLNPFLLDFFSLARGYGIAIAFMMMSLYYFFRFYNEGKQKELVLSLLCAGFSVTANFALLNYFFALLAIYQVVLWNKYKTLRAMLTGNLITGLFLVAVSVFCFEPLRMLIKNHQLYFGGTNGIWEDTVCGSVTAFLYKQYYDQAGSLIFLMLIIATAIFFASRMFFFLSRKKLPENKEGIIFISAGILIGILFLSFFQHLFLDSAYLQERYAAFLVPLFYICFMGFMNFVAGVRNPFRRAGKILTGAICIALVFHFFRCANLSTTFSWAYDGGTKEMLADLKKDFESRNSKRQIAIGITWLVEPTINFYRNSCNINWLKKVTRDGPGGYYNYYYVLDEEDMEEHKNAIKFVKEYRVSGTRLYRNNEQR